MLDLARRGVALACIGVLAISAATAAAEESLSGQIDELIVAKAGKYKPARVVDDAGFLRRVYLDLAGRIPTVDEARAFLADSSPDKRSKLIQQLLGSKEYPR